jgi:hypothetical protein
MAAVRQKADPLAGGLCFRVVPILLQKSVDGFCEQ